MFDISVLIIGIVSNCALSSGAIQRPQFGQKIIAFCVRFLWEVFPCVNLYSKDVFCVVAFLPIMHQKI